MTDDKLEDKMPSRRDDNPEFLFSRMVTLIEVAQSIGGELDGAEKGRLEATSGERSITASVMDVGNYHIKYRTPDGKTHNFTYSIS